MEKKEEKTQCSTPKIYPAMVAIMRDVEAVKKTSKNMAQNYNFRGIDQVMNSLHATFSKHGVFLLPEVVDYEVTEKVSSKSGAINYRTYVKMLFTFMADDGSNIKVATTGEAADSGDKGMNKAKSIALKYALMQMLLIPTEDAKDPDAETPDATRNMSTAELAANAKNDAMRLFFSEIVSIKTVDDLKDFYNTHAEYHCTPYTTYITQRKNEINSGRA